MNTLKTMIASATLVFAGAILPASAASLTDSAASIHRLHLGPAPFMGSTIDAFNCSAVAVSPTQLVTAAHCVPKQIKDRDLSVVIEDTHEGKFVMRTLLPVEVIRTNYAADTAFLELKTDKFSFDDYVDIADEYSPTMGDEMYALGYPRGDVITLTNGMFTQTVWLETAGLKDYFYKSTVPVTGGSSGGGVFTRDWDPVVQDWDYRLVGMTTAGYRDVSFQNYFSTIDSVHNIVKNLLKPVETEDTSDDTVMHQTEWSDEAIDNLVNQEK